MSQKERNNIITKGKLCLAQCEKVEHWVNFLLLSIPLGLAGYVTIDTVLKQKEFSGLALLILVLFFLLLKHKLNCTRLNVYKTNLSEKEFQKANLAAAKLNDWTILQNKWNYFTAIQQTNWQWDGIKITAILKDGKLHINSMVNPSTRSNPFTLGLNKKNNFALIRQYQSILEGNNVNELVEKEIVQKEEAFWEESEWTFENSIKRIIGYSLTMLFTLLALWMISEKEIQGIIYGLLIIGISVSYIFYDIKLILEKKKRNKN